MEKTRKIELLAEILEVDSSMLTESTHLAEIDTWDSMATLSLIALLEEHFGRSDIDGKRISSFKTIGDILTVLEGDHE